MSVPSAVETVIVGAGQAGLCMSWHLGRAGRPHLVLEKRPLLGGGWQDRWDEFCLVTPNWSSSLPGFSYDGADPDGFMPRAEIASRIARYAEVIDAPVRPDTGVNRLSAGPDGGFHLDTTDGPIDARTVVVATGSFHTPRIPPLAAELPKRLLQIHSHGYRRESDLPPGAVLVVGSGQSGAQLAEELFEAGRRVYLSVGSAGRIPRRYRGRDIHRWLWEVNLEGGRFGVGLPTVDMLTTPLEKFAGNPGLSGHGGGHDTNLREFAARGMTLLGRIDRVEGEQLALAPDLPANLLRADRFFDERFRSFVDRYIDAAGIPAPPDDREDFFFEPPAPDELDLAAAGISTVLWTTGYRLDYGWIDFPIFDEFGYPRGRRGVTEVPGLYFVGLTWQHTMLSNALLGIALEARHIAGQMGLPAEAEVAGSAHVVSGGA
jgi:putative flavoprotein involved in K+ transport